MNSFLLIQSALIAVVTGAIWTGKTGLMCRLQLAI
jgi:hypothetical protein